MQQASQNGHLSGNGAFTEKCQNFFEKRFNFKKCFLTTSCTDALEMAALLINIKLGDEVIVPAYTFVSTALAFARQGAIIRFVNSRTDHPGLDEDHIEKLINKNTKAIVPVHYAGIACDMDKIMTLANKYGVFVIEDAAYGIGSYYKEKPLGSIGHFGCFSFHETKIIHCGEGGMISINDESFIKRAEIIWEKGTNRADFKKGIVNKYEWIDTGSSFLMSEINAAFLYAQLVDFDNILQRRKMQWELYYQSLTELQNKGFLKIPEVPTYSEINHSIFYIITRNLKERSLLLDNLNKAGIMAVTHYLDLSASPYIQCKYPKLKHFTPNCQKYQNTLIRLPLYHDLSLDQIIEITDIVKRFYYN